MYRKSQVTASIIFNIPLMYADGVQAVALGLGTLSTKIIGPDGLAIVGYDEATFTEPNADGVYTVKFLNTAANKAFNAVDEMNPHTVILDSSVVDVEPTSEYVWIVSQFPWDNQEIIDKIDSSLLRRIATTIPQTVFVPDAGDKWVDALILLYDTVGSPFDPPDNTNYNARIDVLTVDGLGAVLTAGVVAGYEGKGYANGQTITDAILYSGTTGGSLAEFTADTVDVDGKITGLSVLFPGSGYNADNILRGHSHRPNYNYDGLGAVITQEDGTKHVCYKADHLSVLDSVAVCHHAAAANKPQIFERISKGVYHFHIKVTPTSVLETIHYLISWFDVAGDTSTHQKELTQMTISQAGGLLVLPTLAGTVTQSYALSAQSMLIVRGDSFRLTFNLGTSCVGWNPFFAMRDALKGTYVVPSKAATWIDDTLGTGFVDVTAAENIVLGVMEGEIELRNGAERNTPLKVKITIVDDVVK